MPRFMALISRPSVKERGQKIETFETIVAASKEEALQKLKLWNQTASTIEVWQVLNLMTGDGE